MFTPTQHGNHSLAQVFAVNEWQKRHMGNENSGRRPQPNALKVLRGNPGKRRLLDEVKPPTGQVVKPEGLSQAAGAIWDELSPVCLYMGTLTPADALPFAVLCELQATMVKASSQKDAPGFGMFTLSEDYNGAAKVGVHAAIKVERETAMALKSYYEYFGLTPSSRARLTVPKAEPKEPESKWAGVLK